MNNAPDIFRFQAKLQEGARQKQYLLLELPEEVSQKFPSHGVTRIEGTINDQPFRAPLEAGHSLHVNKAMQKNAKAGDLVNLIILGPEPELVIPDDLQSVLDAAPAAKAFWDTLPPEIHRDWVRWIILAKQAPTRARRITRTIDQLLERKRRPCCVNFYEYMLLRIEEDSHHQ
jgi:hypothetical protein